MSRRKIKNGKKERGEGKHVPRPGSHAHKRARKLRALDLMRKHNKVLRELAEAKVKEEAEEVARVAETEPDPTDSDERNGD